MTTTTGPEGPPAAPVPAPSPAPVRGRRTWRVSPSGLRTVITLELRQRVRSSRWAVVLGVWMLVLGGLTTLLVLAADDMSGADGDVAGRLVFSLVALLVLMMGSLVAPAMSATSINGDRASGVLATLQATLLTPAEIALGKLLAAWVTALAFLVAGLPFVLWAFLLGGTSVSRLLVVELSLAVLLLVVCAVGLGCSALAARSVTSTVLTYLVLSVFWIGGPMVFGLTVTSTSETVPTTYVTMESDDYTSDDPTYTCKEYPSTTEVFHTERTWWLLGAAPYVVLADMAPSPGADASDDLLAGIRDGVRELRLGQDADTSQSCDDYDTSSGADSTYEQEEAARAEARDGLSPSWPYGLAIELLVAGGLTVVAVRRLRAPVRTLPRGTRIA